MRSSVGVGLGLVAIVAWASAVAGCSDDDPEAPVPTPPDTSVTDTVAEATDTVPTSGSEPPGTGLITIDGPATVDSSFSGAQAGGG